MTDSADFVTGVIIPTLGQMNDRSDHPGRYNSLNVVKLLTMIAAHESHFKHRKQIGGPALSFYQIEPATLDDLYTNYLSFRPGSQDLVASFETDDDRYEQLQTNDAYASCVARMILWRVPQALPDYTDDVGLSEYAKTYWNTPLGKATPEKYLNDFKRYGPSDDFWRDLFRQQSA